ncbi:anaerobic dehydrogenases, typically selenocysteine-containing [Paenibacillus sp. NAIST15-1]|nr:anaerobic dehydrogenases, typically selenocysteine-containing [Paenibacillus sp. NAIST15-1]
MVNWASEDTKLEFLEGYIIKEFLWNEVGDRITIKLTSGDIVEIYNERITFNGNEVVNGKVMNR